MLLKLTLGYDAHNLKKVVVNTDYIVTMRQINPSSYDPSNTLIILGHSGEEPEMMKVVETLDQIQQTLDYFNKGVVTMNA